MRAPITALIRLGTEFYEKFPGLFPQSDIRSYFVGNQPLIDENGWRNSLLQAAYFILAVRSLGLDCGPMSGFDADKPKHYARPVPFPEGAPAQGAGSTDIPTKSSVHAACVSPAASPGIAVS